MLELKGVKGFYGDAQVLFDINLKIERGEVVALFGRNGVGKTTTFRTIMGLTPPRWEGDILYEGRSLRGLPSYKIARRGIGFVPEDRQIFPNLTVRRNLIVGRKSLEGKPKKWDLEKIYQVFPKLKTLEDKLGSQLSGGEQQMLTIGRTLMGDPEVMLLDEPTEGLAPLIALDVFNMILETRKAHDTSIFLVEQFSPHLLDYIDRCYVMDRGRIVYDGPPQTIKADPELQRRLLGLGGAEHGAAEARAPARTSSN
jgi:branched-chain amino acid transport system ATP-binding protein